ncbi:28861_t:CDS:1, partial [Racocetra persica]
TDSIIIKMQRLKQTYMNTIQEELIIYNNQLFLTNLVKSFLTTNLDYLFSNNSNEVNYNLSQELSTYSFQDIESIYNYLES